MSAKRCSWSAVLHVARALAVLGACLGASGQDTLSYGVAAGDPGPTSIVLWARVTLDPAQPAPPTRCVKFEIFEEATGVLARTTVPCGNAGNDWVAKRTRRHLKPATRYRFTATICLQIKTQCVGDMRTGRFKTLPANDADVSQVKFASMSCSNWPAGFFNVYQVLSQPEFRDLDFVMHLGDWIYEYPVEGPEAYGSVAERIATFKASPDFPALLGDFPKTVDQFRARHRLYRSDPALQAMLAQQTLISAWDDHEFKNDIYASEPNTTDLVDAALQAYYEWMPIRDPDACLAASQNGGPSTDPACLAARRDRLKSGSGFYSFGKLAMLVTPESRIVARTRQISLNPTGSYRQMLGSAFYLGAAVFSTAPADVATTAAVLGPRCAALKTELATNDGLIYGPDQIQRIREAYAQAKATWNVLGSQTVMQRIVTPNLAQLTSKLGTNKAAAFRRTFRRAQGSSTVVPNPYAPGNYTGLLRSAFSKTIANTFVGFGASGFCQTSYLIDSWDGYGKERDRMYELACNVTGGVCKGNFISCTGDAHTNYIGTHFGPNGEVIGYDTGAQGINSPGIESLVDAFNLFFYLVPNYNKIPTDCVCDVATPFSPGVDCSVCDTDFASCPQPCLDDACCAVKDIQVLVTKLNSAAEAGFLAATPGMLQIHIGKEYHGFQLNVATKTEWTTTPVFVGGYETDQCISDGMAACPYTFGTPNVFPAPA